MPLRAKKIDKSDIFLCLSGFQSIHHPVPDFQTQGIFMPVFKKSGQYYNDVGNK